MRSLGILGGTFDPVHCGHLRLALEVRQRLGLDALSLVPARAPALRDTPQASDDHRVTLLKAAIRNLQGLSLDTRELHRQGPSYTVDTLLEIRSERPNDALVLILGLDAFARLEKWHRWQELTELAHIAVATRPGSSLDEGGALHTLLAQHRARPCRDLVSHPAGIVKLLDIPLLDISATYLRRCLATGRDISLLTPDPVIRLIEEHNLYDTTK